MSTNENPLTFFEYILNEQNISKEIERLFYCYDVQSFHFINSTKLGFEEQNEYGKIETREITVKELLLPLLYREFQKSKSYLYNYCISSSNELARKYLKIQINYLQSLININKHIINQHTYFLLPIRGLVRYINEVLLLEGMEPFNLDDKLLEIQNNVAVLSDDEIVFNTTDISDKDLILSIFNYMNGLNENKKKILSDEDYSLLISYTTYLIENESVPIIKKQIEPNITAELIRFSYWVLHKEIYTTKRIRPYFYDFIKAVFINFKDYEISSIKKIFGVKKNRFTNDAFLPEIIKKYL